MTRVVRLAVVATLAAAAPAHAEICVDVAPGQTAPNATICASSVLKPQGANTYGPENLKGDTAKAWCEGAPGDGHGEYVRIAYGEPVAFRSVVVGNGYQKSRDTYYDNARARTVRIETGDGISHAAEIPDGGKHHTIRLPRMARTNSLRLTIVDVHRGERHADLCLFQFAPVFEAR